MSVVTSHTAIYPPLTLLPPHSLVEAYTISCHYPTIPGTNLTEPRMSIVDSINNITIGDNTVKDAAAGSSKGPKLSLTNGRTAQTVAELKKSIRVSEGWYGEPAAQTDGECTTTGHHKDFVLKLRSPGRVAW